jgi:hypothetical protein
MTGGGLSDIIFITYNGLRWRDAQAKCRSPKTRLTTAGSAERDGHVRPDDGGLASEADAPETV